MAEPGKYLIGESLREKLKSTISKVDSLSLGGPVSRIPTRFEEGTSQPGNALRIAAFTGTSLWVYMETRQISFTETDTAASSTTRLPLRTTESTATAIASMFSIPGVTSSASSATALVVVSKMNGVWHVVSST